MAKKKVVFMTIKDKSIEATLQGHITRMGFDYKMHTTEKINVVSLIDWDDVENGEEK